MKKVYLKSSVQKVLEIISITLFILLISINDFEWRGIPIIIGAILVLLFNVYILDKYGRNVNG